MSTAMHASPTRRLRKLLAALAVAAVLAAVFWLYSRPEMAFDLATKLWSCL